MRGRAGWAAAVALTLALVAGACAGDAEPEGAVSNSVVDPGSCVVVDVAASPEKIDLVESLAKTFNDEGVELPSGDCIFVRPQRKSSGEAASLLADGWDEDMEGPRPTIWSPAASSWGAIVNRRLAIAAQPAIVPDDPTPFMLTPLVIAMPEPMAAALGYPDEPIGWADLARLARDPRGWAAVGRPEWGPFRLGKTNPNYSTSGLNALVAQTYAGVGSTSDLSREDVADPEVVDFSRQIESAVVHYGDITLTFLQNWYRADRRDTALTYASAVAVEEKSLIDYNAGNPDGILDPGEEPRPPRIPLVAVYPKEGTLYSDNPFFVLDASWVSPEEKDAAARFGDFVQRPENQARVLEYGFRPGNPDVEVGEPVVAANGVDPSQPETLLEVPRPEVMVDVLESWTRLRKPARVMLTLDVSGSMGDPADAEGVDTKLDLAKTAAISALEQFEPQDQVGLRIFSTELGPSGTASYLDLVPIEPTATNGEELRRRIGELRPQQGTPLLEVAQQSYRDMLAGYDPGAINAVLLLTDGQNQDGVPADDEDQLAGLLDELGAAESGEESRPVRIFTISYGTDADRATLDAIAEASNAASYDASDAATIDRVFAQVVSNF